MKNQEIQMVNGSELLRQTVKTVLSTNKGEWSLNINEGIDFYNILGKRKIKPKSDKQAALENENSYLRLKLSEYDKDSSEMNSLLEKRLDGES